MTELIKAPAMPGTKRKQAAALAYNVKWMAETFGAERIGFLTLTCGDKEVAGFKKVSSRREASRRFNSLLTHVIRERYQCGVTVTERHKDGGIHFHLVCVVGGDIRTGIDYEACFPARTQARAKAGGFSSDSKPIERTRTPHAVTSGIPDYSTAPPRLRLEWKFWRETAGKFGFGRCQLQPMKANAEALGFYVAKYISKDLANRHVDDKGGRCVRYFGRWDKGGVKVGPPMSARHGSMTAKARAWRKGLKYITRFWYHSYKIRKDYVEVTQNNIKLKFGPRWAFAITQWMRRTVWPEVGREDEREAWRSSNAEVLAVYPKTPGIEEFSEGTICPSNPADREVTREQWEARDWSEASRWRYLDETAVDAARAWAEKLASD